MLLFNYYNVITNLYNNNLSSIIKEHNNVEFNIIKKTYIQYVGEILFIFLKNGTIKKGMIINNRIILSIHNNMIDCNEINAPATISIRII